MAKISVIMSTYNESIEQIIKSIESILQQTIQEFEFIIVDDNPKNIEILHLLKEYEKKDNRIKIIINDKNLGLAKSLNKGIEACKSKYIARMDADDISINNRLEIEYKFLETNSQIDAVSGNSIIIDENDNIISKNELKYYDNDIIKKILPYQNIIVHPAVMIKTDIIKKLNGYRNFPAAQDYDLWLRMVTNNYKIVILDHYLLKYRSSNTNISHSKAFKQYCCNKYSVRLFYERKTKKYDSFSIEKLNKYLLKKKANNKEINYKYLKAIDTCKIAIKKIKKHKYFTGFLQLMYSVFLNKNIIMLLFKRYKYRKILKHSQKIKSISCEIEQ